MWRKLADAAFWIGLALYFGGIAAIAVAAPAVFKTAQEKQLKLPGIADPPLDMGNQVGGEIFGNVLYNFRIIEAIALALMLVGIGTWVLGHKHVRRSTWVILTLWAMVAAITAVDIGWLQNRIWELRETVRQQAPAHAAEGKGARWPERIQFDTLHHWDESLGHAKAYILLGMILVASWRGLADKRSSYAPDAPDVLRRTMSKQP